MKKASLSIIEDTQNHRFVMIRHHRGINEGYVNFPGGKQEAGETMLECVKRETLEETGLIITDPIEVGYIEFPTMDFYVHVYKSTQFSGELRAKKDEVDVFWQDADSVPYAAMREADKDFLPPILSGQYIKRRYFYTPDFKVAKIEDISD
jgi:8-oxo-dGTP diphosphatase